MAAELPDRVERLRRSARTRRLSARSVRYLLLVAVAILALAGVRAILAPTEPVSPAPAATADPAAESDHRMTENRRIIEWVRGSLHERVVSYKIALERMVIAAPSPICHVQPRSGRCATVWP